MADYKIPKALKGRLDNAAKKHNFASGDAMAEHFITRGLKAYDAPAGSIREQLEFLVEERGYAEVQEAVEHLLIRGLRAYEESTSSPEELEARLRGLGYID